MNAPLVSVIVPNYNYAQYLQKRIDTILYQTYGNIEVILLDDASSDESIRILRGYEADKRVSCIVVNEQNTGSPFKQWLKGIELARGRYIWIAECDDYADERFLERTVFLMETFPSAAYAFTGSFIIDEDGVKQDKDMDQWTDRQLNVSDKCKVFDGKEYVSRNLYWSNYVYNASGALFRKDAFLKMKDDAWLTMRYCGDWLFWSLLALEGDVIEVYERLNYFRRHSSCLTYLSSRDGGDYLESMKVVACIERHVQIGNYRRWICHGRYYKWIKRLNMEILVKKELRHTLRMQFKNVIWAYCFERINKTVCEFLHIGKIDEIDRWR